MSGQNVTLERGNLLLLGHSQREGDLYLGTAQAQVLVQKPHLLMGFNSSLLDNSQGERFPI